MHNKIMCVYNIKILELHFYIILMYTFFKDTKYEKKYIIFLLFTLSLYLLNSVNVTMEI